MKEEQQRSLPTILKKNPKKEDMEYTEAITLMSGGELEELVDESKTHLFLSPIFMYF